VLRLNLRENYALEKVCPGHLTCLNASHVDGRTHGSFEFYASSLDSYLHRAQDKRDNDIKICILAMIYAVIQARNNFLLVFL
jgi:hypothetical protein